MPSSFTANTPVTTHHQNKLHALKLKLTPPVSSPLSMASPPFFLLFILLTFLPGGAPDLSGDAAALLAFRAVVGPFVLKWNATASPCSWRGVSCSGGRVTALRLPGVGLIGEIPAGTFANLTELNTLSLRLNALSGSLSPDIASMKNLRGLFLNGNRLSGELPNALFSLPVLSRLDLSTNNFSGEISPGFNNLTSLKVLRLENNHFSGKIPDINLRRFVQFNVSYNNFTGSVPRGLSSAPATAFLGMPLCGAPLQRCATETPPSPSPSPSTSPSPFPSPSPATAAPAGNRHIGDKGAKQSSKLSGGAIAGIAVGSAVGLLILIAIFIVLCRRGGGERQARSVAAAAASAGASANGAAADKAGRRLVFIRGSPEFELEDLLRASAEVLGKGAYGTAYKAVLDGGLTVAVKRLRDVNLEEREFRGRILAVGSVDHRNVLKLMAYHYSKDEKLLVYEYLPGGSLSSFLHGNGGSVLNTLDWRKRCRIALAAARGIEFIHSTSSTASHGNIKSSNILLHKQDDARVADYGIAQLVRQSTVNHTVGYRAPEVTIDARKVSQMADVYSFGVLLLELLTGKAPTQTVQNAEGLDLPRWVRSVAPEEWKSELFDLELMRQQNAEECMAQLLHLALECTAQYPADRPSMSEVVVGIERICNSSLESSSGGQVHDDSYSSRRTESIDESRL